MLLEVIRNMITFFYKVKIFFRRIANFLLVILKNFNPYLYIGRGSKILHCRFSKYNWIGDNTNVMCSRIDMFSYIGSNCNLSNTIIGKYTSIGPNVHLASGNHPIHYLSTSPATYRKTFMCFNPHLLKSNLFDFEHALIEDYDDIYCKIGNDVWIASNVTLVCGKKAIVIGDGSIIKAGSVVTKDVPPYAIVSGNPAAIVKYRFSEEIIKRIVEENWWNKPLSWIKEKAMIFPNIDKCYDDFIKKRSDD